MSRELVVGDYMFSTMEEANVAKLELEKIEKLNEKLTDADVDLLYKVYCRSIEKNTFRTPVGLDFMKNLKNKIEKSGKYKDKILPVPVNMPTFESVDKNEVKDELKKSKNDSKKYSSLFKWSLFINIILAVVIIALFVIASTSNNPNIINYENALIDKYSAWESELKDKEKELKIKENEIKDASNNLINSNSSE